MKPNASFSFDADEQKMLDADRLAEQRCLADKNRLDSLAQAGHFIGLTLPAATQQGANVFGCLVDNEVWRDYDTCFDGHSCIDCGARGWLQPIPGHKQGYKFGVRAFLNNGPTEKELWLYLPLVTGLGTYRLGRKELIADADKANAEAARLILAENEQREEHRTVRVSYDNTLDPLSTVTITRFDTVAHIVAGTFVGAVKRRDSVQVVKVISKGRFDVHYNIADLQKPRYERPAKDQ
jgi:hypothetical protein